MAEFREYYDHFPPGTRPGAVPARPGLAASSVFPRDRRPYPDVRCAGAGVGLGQRVAELAAGTDAQLAEHLAQVPFDRADAEKEFSADIGVAAPVPGQPGNVCFLRGELGAANTISTDSASSRRATNASV